MMVEFSPMVVESRLGFRCVVSPGSLVLVVLGAQCFRATDAASDFKYRESGVYIFFLKAPLLSSLKKKKTRIESLN